MASLSCGVTCITLGGNTFDAAPPETGFPPAAGGAGVAPLPTKKQNYIFIE